MLSAMLKEHQKSLGEKKENVARKKEEALKSAADLGSALVVNISDEYVDSVSAYNWITWTELIN